MTLWKSLHASAALLFTLSLIFAETAGPALPFDQKAPANFFLGLMYAGFVAFFLLAARKTPGIADAVTLLRPAGVLPLLVLPWSAEAHWLPASAALGLLALSDLLDGRLARRYGTSAAGAVLDEEADAFFTLMLCYLLYSRAGFGLWLPVAGSVRYLLVILYRTAAKRGGRTDGEEEISYSPAFTRFSRAVCALSVAMLIGGFVVPLPEALRTALPAVAVALLLVSFTWEAGIRFSARIALPPRGFLRSWLIYYGLPGKRLRMNRLYGEFLRPGGLAFDLGSHLGNRIPVWRRLGAEVVALEPNPACFRYLEKRYGGRSGVLLLSKAVGARSGEADLHIDARYPTLATLSNEWMEEVSQTGAFRKIDWDRSVRVEVTTLESLIDACGVPDFCKIDVEGYEAEVLSSLGRPLPALSFEYLPQSRGRAERCLDILEALGRYEYRVSRRETMRFLDLRNGSGPPAWGVGAEEVRAFLRNLRDGDAAGDIYGRLLE